jgi:23S rRNA (cytidine1920-2'-O)/16S rRNA (cytidine1409-2'-O)-methyltransferase
LAVGDVSFISLRLVVPVVSDLSVRHAVLLIKPQFEAGREEVSRGNGVISDPDIWRRVLHEVIGHAADVGLDCVDLMVSPITGRAGNVEFVGHFVPGTGNDGDVISMVEAAVSEAGKGTDAPWP